LAAIPPTVIEVIALVDEYKPTLAAICAPALLILLRRVL
jgi:hypothetical protein